MRVPGALQSLETLAFIHHGSDWPAQTLPMLASALAQDGVAPLLRELDVDLGECNAKDMARFSSMLERRAQLPACRGVEVVTEARLNDDELGARHCRLLRAILLTATKLPNLCWASDYEACFLAAPPPRLGAIQLRSAEEEFPSVEVLEAMPVLEELDWGSASIAPVAAALNRGVAFQQLTKLEFTAVRGVVAAAWGSLFEALAGSACAARLTTLRFTRCNLCPVSLATLSRLLGEDALPRLQCLKLDVPFHHDDDNGGIAAEALALLCQGLLAAPSTRLEELDLSNVVIADQGVAGLASLMRGGRFERLWVLQLSAWQEVTQEGLGVLTQAIAEGGLPALSVFGGNRFAWARAVHIKALARALANNCPRLTQLDVSDCISVPVRMCDMKTWAERMVREADARHHLTVKVIKFEEAMRRSYRYR